MPRILNETYVELKGVNKSFGDFKASKDISFDIQKGRLGGTAGADFVVFGRIAGDSVAIYASAQ